MCQDPPRDTGAWYLLINFALQLNLAGDDDIDAYFELVIEPPKGDIRVQENRIVIEITGNPDLPDNNYMGRIESKVIDAVYRWF